jgi:hypothetical protein
LVERFMDYGSARAEQGGCRFGRQSCRLRQNALAGGLDLGRAVVKSLTGVDGVVILQV